MQQIIDDDFKRQTIDLSEYDNSWYDPGPRWKRAVWLVANTLFFNNGLAVFSSFKCWLLRRFGAQIGKRVTIKPSVNIKYPWFLTIGNNTWVGEKVWIDCLARITIADNVCLSQGALLLTGNHNYKLATFDLVLGAIVLEDGVWIGANAMVCPAVTCKSHAVLSAGSVATKDLEAYGIYQGIPAEKIKIRSIE